MDLHPDSLLSDAKESPLLWAAPESWRDTTTHASVQKLHKWARRKKPSTANYLQEAQQWLERLEKLSPEMLGISGLAWLWAWPTVEKRVESSLLESLQSAMEEMIPQETRGGELPEWPRQLLAGELPWALAWRFPNAPKRARWLQLARSVLQDGVKNWLDGDGSPRTELLPSIRPLLACWTRSQYVGRAMGQTLLEDEETDLQYAWLARRVMQWTRADGGQMLADVGEGWRWRPLIDAAVKWCDDVEDQRIADLLFPTQRGGDAPSKKKLAKKLADVETATYSEWAASGVMRSQWSEAAARLAIAFRRFPAVSECEVGAARLWSGEESTQLWVGGKALKPKTQWRELYWQSDDEANYLELEIEYPRGWRIQRQWLLARQSGFLWTADAVLGARPETVRYRRCWPLAEDVQAVPAQQHREAHLQDRQGKKLALAAPVSLPEWRSERGAGELTAEDDGLALQIETSAARFHAPLFWDLQKSRLKSPFTWRRLTVAEKLQIQTPDQAVGYRVQAGPWQWFFYRSLIAPASRTLLGQNLSCEFHAGTFDVEGETETIVSIDQDENEE